VGIKTQLIHKTWITSLCVSRKARTMSIMQQKSFTTCYDCDVRQHENCFSLSQTESYIFTFV